MSKGPLQEPRFLVIVKPNGAVVQTLDHAVREARDLYAEREVPISIDIRVLTREDSVDSRTKHQIKQTLSTFQLPTELQTSLEHLVLAGETVESRTESLLAHLSTRDVSRLITSTDTDVSVERLRERFGVTTVELAPTTTPRERRRLLHPGGLRRLGTIFGLTYLFYLAIGGFAGGLDLLTGAISAGIVALALSHVSLQREPELKRTGWRIARTVAFLPVLFWEIVKANFSIAYIILHPDLPIDPSIEEVETETREGLERVVLANSITLTPGTVTIDVRDRSFTIHSLTAQARSDLQDGRLQRLVAWVFHGSGHTSRQTDETGAEP